MYTIIGQVMCTLLLKMHITGITHKEKTKKISEEASELEH